MNTYPLWKYILICIVVAGSVIYSLPNYYEKEYAVQISAKNNEVLQGEIVDSIKEVLNQAKLPYKGISQDSETLLVRFKGPDSQIKAKDLIKAKLGDGYTVALNLAATTPKWLQAIGAEPMKLGLDLSGGVHFLLAVDVDSLIKHRLASNKREVADALRKGNIRYRSLRAEEDGLLIILRSASDLSKASSIISQNFPDLQKSSITEDGAYKLRASLSPKGRVDAQNFAIDKTMTVLRKRIDELGVNEPIVQRQGADRISVDLPGVQDTARAQQILGGTATVEFHLQDLVHPVSQALAGNVPANSKLYQYNGMPVLLQDRSILSGASITDARSNIAENGKAAVNIRLGGGGEAMFYRITGENIGKPLAVVFIETIMKPKIVNGELEYISRKVEKVISIATIQSALPSSFQIDGLADLREARDLALLLRAGSLPTSIAIIEENTIGPSMGKANIQKGLVSIQIGFMLIILFMTVYYRLFGLLANLALGMNLVLVVAIQSIIGATLSLPGIAAILLTMGMAVDANVLIFERIREELRNGMSPQASIQAGYERALATIIDSNVTTLIAAIALLMIGTGAIKGFAVTLTIGLMTSMFTSIMGTRAVANLIYGRRKVTKLSIGIKKGLFNGIF